MERNITKENMRKTAIPIKRGTRNTREIFKRFRFFRGI